MLNAILTGLKVSAFFALILFAVLFAAWAGSLISPVLGIFAGFISTIFIVVTTVCYFD